MSWTSNPAVLLSIVSAAVGAFFAGAGYLIRQYNEQRQVARRVLYNLLNIWEVCLHLSKPIDRVYDFTIDVYKEVLKDLLGPDVLTHLRAEEDELRSMMGPLLVGLIVKYRPGMSNDLELGYKKSVDDLANRHPVLAYKLSGNDRLHIIFRMIDEYEQSTGDYLKKTVAGGVAEFVSMQKFMRNVLSQELLSDLKADILRVACKAGAIDWIRCRNLLHRIEPSMLLSEKRRAEMRQLFEIVLREWFQKIGVVTQT